MSTLKLCLYSLYPSDPLTLPPTPSHPPSMSSLPLFFSLFLLWAASLICTSHASFFRRLRTICAAEPASVKSTMLLFAPRAGVNTSMMRAGAAPCRSQAVKLHVTSSTMTSSSMSSSMSSSSRQMSSAPPPNNLCESQSQVKFQARVAC